MMEMKKMMMVVLMMSATIATQAQTQSLVQDQASAQSSVQSSDQQEQVFTLEVYGGEVPDVKPAFEEEHYLGGEVTKKWNTFLCNYTHTYDVEIGLANSGTEFRKPSVFKAVERANKYVKKNLKAHLMTKQDAIKIMTHVLDCANIICLESDTAALEQAASDTKTGEEAVDFFNHIVLKNA